LAVADHFSAQELEAVRVATREAETKTGGEFVCVIVERCDSYEASVWKAATLGALGAAALAALWQAVRGGWGFAPVPWVLLPPLIGAALGLLAVLLIPPLQRLLIPAGVVERRVDRRAAVAFLDEEIFATRDRSGVLIFVALFEHQIRILRDKGIEEKIAPAEWTEITETLARGLRRGRPGPPLVRAVEDAGELLAQARVERREDDRNELSDEPRLYDD